MAFSNINQLQFGDVLKIVFDKGIQAQTSTDIRDFEYLAKMKEDVALAREYRFALIAGFGHAAFQFRSPGTPNVQFPQGQRENGQEFSAQFKEWQQTIVLDYNQWSRAKDAGDLAYVELLQFEAMRKMTSYKRLLGAEMYGDGTGILGTTALSADTPVTLVGTQVRVQLASPFNNNADLAGSNIRRGHANRLQSGDIILLRKQDGTVSDFQPTVAAGTLYGFRVEGRDRRNHTVTLSAVDSSYNTLSITALGAAQPADNEVFIRIGQPTGGAASSTAGHGSAPASALDLTSITDYGVASEAIPGLQSLAANDGRVIHGITMSGDFAGTGIDRAGVALDVDAIEELMNDVKINVGEDAYDYKMMCMSPEAHSAFVEGRETDRRFHTVQDNARGLVKFMYQHRNSPLEVYSSEFVDPSDAWFLPENKADNGKVLEFIYKDIETVRGPNGSDFHLLPGESGRHLSTIATYMYGAGTLVAKHPAAIGRISNFSL